MPMYKAQALDKNPDLLVDEAVYKQIHDAFIAATEAAARLSYRAEHPRHEHTEPMLRTSAASAIGTANSLIASAAARCRIDPPPAAIRIETDAKGNLVQICGHRPPHRWSISQQRKP